MDQEQEAAAAGTGNAAAEGAAGGQQQRENVASSAAGGRVSGDVGGDGNAAAALAAPLQARAEDLAASFASNVRVSAAAPRDLPPPMASTWPPLSERLERKSAAVREAKASVVAAHGRVAPAIQAHGARGEAIAMRLVEAAQTSLTKANEALEQELARRERLRVAGLLDARGDALPGGAPGAFALAELPDDMIREVFWRLDRREVDNVALVCSDWARIPLDLRACCEEAEVGYGNSATRGQRRGPAVSPDAATMHLRMHDHDGGVRMTREALSAALCASPRLEGLDVRLDLDQLSTLAECLGARSASSSLLRRLFLGLSCPAGASAALTDADMVAMGAALAVSTPGLECFEVALFNPWTHAAEHGPAETLLLSLLSNGGGGGGGGRLREVRANGNFLSSALLSRLRESFALRKMTFLHRWAQPGVFMPRFPPAGRGVSLTLRELRFEVQVDTFPARQPGSLPEVGGPIGIFCDVQGRSVPELQLLAPLAGSVTRLVLDFLGRGTALPQVLRLPGCLRALRSVRSLAVRYPRATGGEMETTAAATAAARAAAARGGADIALARALRPSSTMRRAAAAPQPWDLLSSLTELDVRFLLGNYELVLPRAGLPNLRRLDMRGMIPETFRSAADAGAAAAEPRHHYLPPPPSVVPELRWLGIGFFHPHEDPLPSERRRPRVFDLSALVPAGSSQPYRHLRTLLLENAALVVEGGDEDEEVRRLLGAFPVVFPSLRMIHVHGCGASFTACRVLEGLADAYAAAGAAASAGARGGAGGSSSSSSYSVASSFRDICSGCPEWNYSVDYSDYSVDLLIVYDPEEL